MKKIFAGMFLALSFLAIGTSANAATDITRSSAITFDSGTAAIKDSFAKSGNTPIKGKTFSDSFTFTVGQGFDISSAVISIALPTTSGLDIYSVNLVGSNGVNIASTKSVIGTTQIFSLQASSLAAGNYSLVLLGKITGSSGGSFGGNINVSAVPEVTTTAMMLAGLAIVGFGAFRRRRQNTGRVNMGNIAMA